MANELALKIGTFSLDSGAIYSISSVEIQEQKTINTHKIPKTDGSLAETGRRDFITISIEGTIANTDYDALRTSLDALKAAFQNGLQQFTLDDDRYITAQLSSFDKRYVRMRTLIEFKASFIAHFPFWLALVETDDSRTPVSGVGYVITNNGNAPARCKITITALSSPIVDNIQIQNLTNGKSFQYRGTLLGYQSLVADNRYSTDDFAVTNNSVDDTQNYEGDFITLEAGANTIVFTGAVGAVVDIKYKDCWY